MNSSKMNYQKKVEPSAEIVDALTDLELAGAFDEDGNLDLIKARKANVRVSQIRGLVHWQILESQNRYRFRRTDAEVIDPRKRKILHQGSLTERRHESDGSHPGSIPVSTQDETQPDGAKLKLTPKLAGEVYRPLWDSARARRNWEADTSKTPPELLAYYLKRGLLFEPENKPGQYFIPEQYRGFLPWRKRQLTLAEIKKFISVSKHLGSVSPHRHPLGPEAVYKAEAVGLVVHIGSTWRLANANKRDDLLFAAFEREFKQSAARNQGD